MQTGYIHLTQLTKYLKRDCAMILNLGNVPRCGCLGIGMMGDRRVWSNAIDLPMWTNTERGHSGPPAPVGISNSSGTMGSFGSGIDGGCLFDEERCGHTSA